MKHARVSPEVLDSCRRKLVETKSELLNRARAMREDFIALDRNSGDEIDLTVAHLQEHHYLIANDRIRNQLLEIENALSRIERGEFGICEETLEPIENERLMAVPWTRLSIEGAEIRQSLLKKYARA